MQFAIGEVPIRVNHVLNLFLGKLFEKVHYFLNIEKFQAAAKSYHFKDKEQIIPVILDRNHLQRQYGKKITFKLTFQIIDRN